MEQIAEDQDAPDALSGRLITRSWGNSRPLIWAPGSQDRGRQNARVEVYLSHGEHFELPRRCVPLAAPTVRCRPLLPSVCRRFIDADDISGAVVRWCGDA